MKKTLIALLLSATAATAGAQGYGEITASQVSIDADLGQDVEHLMFTGAIGYNFNPEQKFQNKLEAIAGVAMNDGNVADVEVELENYYGIAYRPTVKVGEELELFGRVLYARVKGSVSQGLSSASDSESETGFGVGASYNGLTLSYTDIDDADFISIGYTFSF